MGVKWSKSRENAMNTDFRYAGPEAWQTVSTDRAVAKQIAGKKSGTTVEKTSLTQLCVVYTIQCTQCQARMTSPSR